MWGSPLSCQKVLLFRNCYTDKQMTTLGMSRRGVRTPTGSTPSPGQGRVTLCDAETAPEPPHKDRWHGASPKKLSSINNLFCRYYCRTRWSPVNRKWSHPCRGPRGDDGNGDRWLMKHQGPSGTQTNAPWCQPILHICRRRWQPGTSSLDFSPSRGGTICRLRYQTFHHPWSVHASQSSEEWRCCSAF